MCQTGVSEPTGPKSNLPRFVQQLIQSRQTPTKKQGFCAGFSLLPVSHGFPMSFPSVSHGFAMGVLEAARGTGSDPAGLQALHAAQAAAGAAKREAQAAEEAKRQLGHQPLGCPERGGAGGRGGVWGGWSSYFFFEGGVRGEGCVGVFFFFF